MLNNMNIKNILKSKTGSYLILLVIGLGFGVAVSYVNAVYVNPAFTSTNDQPPAPILTSDVNGDFPFIKIGKLGINANSLNADQNKFTDNSAVVAGQTVANIGLSVSTSARVNAQIPSTSTKSTMFFGNTADYIVPNDPTTPVVFWQKDGNGNPREFLVKGFTNTARLVVGSKTADPGNYNLYIEPGVNRMRSFNTYREYCTLTADQLKNKGCPYEYSYNYGRVIATYLNQVIPGTGSDVVASCAMFTEQKWPSTPANANRGSCY